MAEISSYTAAATPLLLNTAPPETVGLALHLFGPMDVRVAGQPLPRLRSRKGLWLLALLALRAGGDIERDWLAETLWPDCHQSDAKRSLRQSLHDLRAALGNEAVRLTSQTPRTLRLDVSPGANGIWIDLHFFDAAMDRRKSRLPDALENATRLYRGPLLEDCVDDWVLDARRQREMHYVSALETLASAASATSGFSASADYLRRAVSVAPLREDLQRALMESLAVSGNLPAALLVYRQFRARLWQETASEPDAQTTAHYRKLRDEARKAARIDTPRTQPDASPAAETLQANLPQPRTLLVGRESEAESVVSCFVRARLVTLIGTGGVGKTRLALRVAEMLADDFEGGARFVDLAALTDTAAVPEAVGKSLGVAPDGREPFTQVLCRALSARHILILLDNCEQVLDACARLVDALLSACPGVRVLATSRQTLGLSGETVWRVPSLDIPPPKAALETLEQYTAVQLFIARAREADPTQITSRSVPTVASVCRRLDGIPLAIELAAARLRALTVEEIDARLGSRFRLLTGGDRTALPRQQTLRGTLDWSWNLLSEPEKQLLADLSVFAGGWTLEAVEAVCARADLESDEIFELLIALIDKSLVLAEKQGNGTTRYRLLETVRQYGRDRLAERGETPFVGGRHQEYFTRCACEKLAEGNEAWSTHRNWLESEQDNLRAALEWRNVSEETQRAATAQRALDLAGALCVYWQEMSRLQEGQERLKAALAFAEQAVTDKNADPYRFARAKALRGLASLINESGNYAAALEAYQTTLDAYRKIGDRKNIAATLGEMSMVARFQSDYARAQSLMEESLVLHRDLNDKRLVAFSLSVLGVIAGDRGNLAESRSFLEAALATYQEYGNRDGVARTLNNLGNTLRNMGNYESARTLLEQALVIHREMGSPRSVAITLLNLGGCSGDLENYAAARRQIGEALVVFREAGSADMVASALTALGIIAGKQKDHGEARALLKEALALHREQGSQNLIATTIQYLALGKAAEGQLTCALQVWGAVEQFRERLGAPLQDAEALEHAQEVADVRAMLGHAASDAAWAEGRAMDFDTLCEQALFAF